MRLSSKILILAVLAFLLCLVPGQTHSEPVSRDVEIILLPGFFEQTYTESLNLIEESDKKSRSPVAGAKRIAQVKVNDVVTDVNKIAPGKKVVIDLFDDYRVTATVEQVDACINQVTTTRSRIDETQYGYMVTSALGTRVLAVIEIPEHNKQYRIIFDSVLQEHFMYEYDLDHIDKLDSAPSLKPPGKGYTGDTEGKIFATEFHFEPEGSSDYLELYSGSETAIVDVLVVYTPAAADWADNNVGSIDLVIDQAMSRAQLTLDNSDTLVNMRLVHSGLIDYLEYAGDPIYYPEYGVTASGIYVDLARLTQGTDGFELAHQWRDLYGADLVALFNLSDDIYGGVAWQLYDENGYSDYAFSLTSVSEASWTYTHIHEMGHNMGAGHHKMQNEEPGPGLFSYSAGWRWIGNDDGRYCSVMTYENGGYYADGQTHLEVAHFSNPAISHQGVSTGHAVDGDNARTIREVRNIIAGYRPDAGIPGNFEANAVSMNQIDLSWQQNADGHSVMVVWAPDDVFGTPADGTAYSAGQVLPGGGTVLCSGSNTSYSHLGLEEDTRYYYKAFSYDASNIYTPGAVAFADTFSEAITVYPWTETFEDDSLTRSKWYQAFISGNTGWTLGTGSLGASDYGDGSITTAHDGALNARFTGDSYSNDITRLITPLLDISNLNEPRLTFWYGQERWYEPGPDGWDDQNELRVYYRTTPDSAWVEIFHDDQNRPQWTEKILNLPNPSTTYQIAFEGICNYGFANVLDSVTVSGTSHVHIPDSNLEAAIRDQLSKPTGELTVGDMESLIYLDAADGGIVDLSGLEHAANLEWLKLGDMPSDNSNQISDLSPLSGLIELEYLNLRYNQISNLTPLSGLFNLVELRLKGNQINNLEPLSSLTNLERLGLGQNVITSISSLSELTSLKWLGLPNNQLDDLTPLSGLTGLEVIDLVGNEISDLTPVEGLISLREIYLVSNNISSILPLSGLTNLEWIHLGENEVDNLAPLSNLSKLRGLQLQFNQIYNLTPLAGLTALEVLELCGNSISDLSPLSGLTNLKKLDLCFNDISSIGPLADKSYLQDLDLTYNYIDINPGSLAMAVICNAPRCQDRKLSDLSYALLSFFDNYAASLKLAL